MRCLVVLMPVFFAPVDLARAQAGGDYAITRSAVAGGGREASAGTWSLSGTVGQPLASAAATGGGYALRGGFQLPAGSPSAIFSDGFED